MGAMNRTCFSLVVLVVTTAAWSACAREPRTPDEARARGDELLRKMSDTLAQAHTFSFETAESHERVRRNGQKAERRSTRRVVVRRPDRLTLHQTGEDQDFTVWYDGRGLTIVGDRQRIFARTAVPPTLDAMLDDVSDRLEVPLPMADVLYSSPYDALVGEGSTGGWVRRTQVNGQSCEELTYQHSAVDFTLSVSTASPVLPCQLVITYKDGPGRPSSRLTFSNWNLREQATDAAFTATVPSTYEEIPIVERIAKSELRKPAAAPEPPAKRERP